MSENWEERSGGAFWKPLDEGDAVEGKLLKVRQGQYGDVYDIEQSDGIVVTIPTSAVLANRISAGDEGKEIRVVYDGQMQSKIKGRKNFSGIQQDFSRSCSESKFLINFTVINRKALLHISSV